MTNMPSVWFNRVQVSLRRYINTGHTGHLKYDQCFWRSSDSCELWTDGRKTPCHRISSSVLWIDEFKKKKKSIPVLNMSEH